MKRACRTIGRGARVVVLLIVLALLWCGCPPSNPIPEKVEEETPTPTPAPPVEKVPESGWSVERYLAFNKAWASITAGSPGQVTLLTNNVKRSLIQNGFVATDLSGQALLTKDTCLVYVFQESNLGVAEEYVTLDSCAEDTGGTDCTLRSTQAFQDCISTMVHASAADVTFMGTLATVIDDAERGLTLVLVHHGMAIVTPTNSVLTDAFEVPASQAVYVAQTGRQEELFELFEGRHQQGELFALADSVPVLSSPALGLQPQVQRLNLLLLREDLPIIPLAQPVTLGLRPLSSKLDTPLAALAFGAVLSWGDAMKETFEGQDVPIYFVYSDDSIDLRKEPYDPGMAAEWLAEQGFTKDRPLRIWYDAGIAPLERLAAMLEESPSRIDDGFAGAFLLSPVRAADVDPAFLEALAGSEPAMFFGGW